MNGGGKMSEENYTAVEGTTIDYKAQVEIRKPKSWLKSVSAFANTNGGNIIFGIDDSHKPIGLSDAQNDASKVTELIKERIHPTPRFDLSSFDGEQGACINLHIGAGPAYPYYYDFQGIREAYIRIGDQSVKAADHMLNNLILKGLNKTFDGLPGSFKVGEVSFTLLGATYRQETGFTFDYEKDLISMGLSSVDGQVTNAGLLLCDQGLLSQSRIFCTRWKGELKGAIGDDALDDKEFDGCSLITLLQNAEDFIRNNSRTPWTIRGMQREEQSDYPLRAVREALVNALIHRDYQILGSEIHVDIFDDRLEITSPGGMINGQQIQNMDLNHIPSMRRNLIISDLFARLNLMERRGSGIGRIRSAYSGCERQPEFYSDLNFFIVTLPNRGKAENKTEHEENSISYHGSQSDIYLTQTNVSVGANFPAEIIPIDPEIEEFRNRVTATMSSAMPHSISRLIEMFKRYRYTYSFNRNNVADLYGVSTIRASSIIKELLSHNLIRKEKRGEYYFTTDEPPK